MNVVVEWLRPYAKRLAVVATIAVVLALPPYLLWQQIGSRVLSDRSYLVYDEDIHITPPPRWIHSDIRELALRDASIDPPMPLLDDQLVEDIAGAFAASPWVKAVRSVQKHHPARIDVELEYRRPVCVVAQSTGNSRQLVPRPVDVEGTLLPAQEFSLVDLRRYPRVDGIATTPVGPPGTHWGDPAVAAAARIADALADLWEPLGLKRIGPMSRQSGNPSLAGSFEIHADDGTRIIWGRAPGEADSREPPTADKVARLRRWAEQQRAVGVGPVRGTLDLREHTAIGELSAAASREGTAAR
ncbi:MAG: hypothetical protein R3C10_17710 [Pirellulales bacterium]|nr:hypothetical protein [Planctomycetales bacterium]